MTAGDAKQLRDMADVLYRQGRDAEYIIGALIGYAREAGVPLPPTQRDATAPDWLRPKLPVWPRSAASREQEPS